jgi:4-hydroxy-tetrahydrodipicolinate synthase
MAHANLMTGVLSPVITPFDGQLTLNSALLVKHCRWLLDNNVGLAIFGTNSEGNSLSTEEKIVLMEDLIDAGLPPERMMPGTGCCTLPDTIALTRRAVELGCGGVLRLPPFYYKGVSDDGLYRAFAEVIERIGDSRLQIYLYHIPPIAQVGISLPVIERLLKDHPGTVVGIKDSLGDWNNTRTMLEEFGGEQFNIFPGSETFLLQGLRHGGAGCISATANVNPKAIARLAATWQQPDADARQAALDQVRDIFQGYIMIPAMKAAVAHFSDTPGWRRVRPPLAPFEDAQSETLIQSLVNNGFTMDGLSEA